ncbi:hypothetical protein SLEP1_g48883 [Rubroshorea leprosula]|uniref:Uncharacterized protein n=1 Tax=Rubroshorea leprosula TaxID=152421 RepID=A0AAV5LY48_9ROSI|nr:hypothetical protein SLEP1_g48883 [Rubroshorea leprosula]
MAEPERTWRKAESREPTAPVVEEAKTLFILESNEAYCCVSIVFDNWKESGGRQKQDNQLQRLLRKLKACLFWKAMKLIVALGLCLMFHNSVAFKKLRERERNPRADREKKENGEKKGEKKPREKMQKQRRNSGEEDTRRRGIKRRARKSCILEVFLRVN